MADFDDDDALEQRTFVTFTKRYNSRGPATSRAQRPSQAQTRPSTTARTVSRESLPPNTALQQAFPLSPRPSPAQTQRHHTKPLLVKELLVRFMLTPAGSRVPHHKSANVADLSLLDRLFALTQDMPQPEGDAYIKHLVRRLLWCIGCKTVVARLTVHVL